jgi:hypothetical protein
MVAFKLRSRHRTVKQVFDQKMKIILATRTHWSMHASKTEDEQLRDPAWDCKYQGTRPLFWDNTGINLHKATGALLQRITYYAGNVAKATNSQDSYTTTTTPRRMQQQGHQ